MAMRYKTRVWLHGLMAATISGASNSVLVVLVDPLTFNLFQGGAGKLGIVMAGTAILAFFTYLKSHPLPDPDKDMDYTAVANAAMDKIQGTADNGTTITGGGTGDGRML